jgi:hypothetical protein
MNQILLKMVRTSRSVITNDTKKTNYTNKTSSFFFVTFGSFVKFVLKDSGSNLSGSGVGQCWLPVTELCAQYLARI